MVNTKDDTYYINEGISREEIIYKCQISEAEFDSLVNGKGKNELRIVEVSQNRYAYFSDIEIYDLFD
jgi:hypothetical protein